MSCVSRRQEPRTKEGKVSRNSFWSLVHFSVPGPFSSFRWRSRPADRAGRATGTGRGRAVKSSCVPVSVPDDPAARELSASMGPLPVGSGRRPRAEHGRCPWVGLQWGRSRSGAEDMEQDGRAAYAVALQWGRSRSGAEDDRTVRDKPRLPVVLQWGRSRSGAEDGAGEAGVEFSELASMGPLPVGSGRPRGRHPPRPVRRCFNGAAPGRERKTRETPAATRRS